MSATEHHGLINEDTADGSIAFRDQHINLVNNDSPESTGTFHPQVEERRKQSRKIETIFDDVRKRLKNIPVLNKSGGMEGWSSLETNTFFSREPSVSSSIVLDSNPSAIEDNESSPMETLKDKKHLSPRRTLDLPFEFFDSPTRPSTIQPTFNILPLRTETQLEPPGDSTAPENRNTLNRLTGANTESCFMQTEVKTREVESFLGFKSVFSFL